MSGTGISFTGVIGVGQVAPTEVFFVSGSNSGGPPQSVTIGAPIGIVAGNLMVACVSAGAYAGGGGPYTFTPDPAWTPVYEDPDDGLTHQIIANLYSKVADSGDEAGTASYTWTVSTGTAAGIAAAIVGWPNRYGATISNPAVDHTSTPSVSSPGGRWQLSYIVQRTASSFGQPQPLPVVTSTATLLVPVFAGARSGALAVYASENISPIAGEYQQSIDFPRQALVVAAVSP